MRSIWKSFLTQACSAVTLLTLRHSSGMYGNRDGECVFPTERNELTDPLDCGKNWAVEQLQWGKHMRPRLILLPPACCSTMATSLAAREPKKKKLLKFTRQKSNWELIIKMYLASGTSLISYILLYSSPFQNSKTMPQVPGPNYLPAKEREQQREREHSAAVLRDRKAWYNSWIPARPHGDPWPASLLSASIASVDGASTALQIRPK